MSCSLRLASLRFLASLVMDPSKRLKAGFVFFSSLFPSLSKFRIAPSADNPDFLRSCGNGLGFLKLNGFSSVPSESESELCSKALSIGVGGKVEVRGGIPRASSGMTPPMRLYLGLIFYRCTPFARAPISSRFLRPPMPMPTNFFFLFFPFFLLHRPAWACSRNGPGSKSGMSLEDTPKSSGAGRPPASIVRRRRSTWNSRVFRNRSRQVLMRFLLPYCLLSLSFFNKGYDLRRFFVFVCNSYGLSSEVIVDVMYLDDTFFCFFFSSTSHGCLYA